MTTPNDIDDDLTEVSDAILGDLSPEQRTKLSVEAIASGREEHVEKLKAAAPRKTYEAADLDYAEYMRDVLMQAAYTWHELERGIHLFHLTRLEGRYHSELAANHDVEDWDWVDEPSEENDYHEGEAMDAAARFLKDYRKWEQFAAEILAVDLPSFLSVATPDHWIEQIEDMRRLAEGSESEELLDLEDTDLDPDDLGDLEDADNEFEDYEPGWAGGRTITVDGEELSIDEAAEREAAELIQVWKEEHVDAPPAFDGEEHGYDPGDTRRRQWWNGGEN